MRIFPDFTWEWIIQSCEQILEQLQRFERENGFLWESQKGYIQNAEGLIAIVPVLRDHPELGKLVPMKSLITLRWFPCPGYEVTLFCVEKDVYEVEVIKGDFEVEEKRVVGFNDVADEVYSYITKYRVD